MMYATERYRSIVERVVGKGRASVVDLAGDLDVTPETIRRDLSYLESQGLVRRVHGGAVPVGRVFIEPSVDTRNEVLVKVKDRIARAALAEVPRQGAVIVDAGSTTGRMLDMIPEDYELTIITDSVEHAMRLAQRESITTMLVGGRVRGRTLACVDQWAVNALSGIVADLAIIGTNGIDPVRGLTTPDMAEANVKRAMLRCARRTVVVADHTKFGSEHFANFAALSDIDVLITDDATPSHYLEQIASPALSVVVA
jgi:DeoR family fructose operon transcriptional repressor